MVKEFLKSGPFNHFWDAYLEAVANNSTLSFDDYPKLGHFFLVRDQQLQVTSRVDGSVVETESHSQPSASSKPPLKHRARPPPGKYTIPSESGFEEDSEMTDVDQSPRSQSSPSQQSPKSQQTPPSGHTPESKRSSTPRQVPRTPELQRIPQSPGKTPSSTLPASLHSPGQSSWRQTPAAESDRVTGASTRSGLETDRRDDEEIVNVALYLFLNSATLCSPTSSARWVARRQLFEFGRGTTKAFKARTDGVLEGEGGAIRAIMEVKPYQRVIQQQVIQWQETCEMVAWIYERGEDEISFVRDGETYKRYQCLCPRIVQSASRLVLTVKTRRILISQDYDEIFLIFAEYSDKYKEFLHGKTLDQKDKKEVFLIMTQSRRLPTNDPHDMTVMGKAALAMARQPVNSEG